MPFSVWIYQHRRSLLFLLVILCLAGVFSYQKLKVSLFPHTDFPRIAVSLDAGDRSAEQMLLEATQPAEERLRQIPGVQSVRSTTSRGSADLSVSFPWGQPMDLAALQVSSALAELSASLPSGTTIQSYRMDPTRFPILAYSLKSTDLRQLTTSQLRLIAQMQLLPLISGITGVARVEIQGGDTQEFQINIDPWRCQALGISAQDVTEAIHNTLVLNAAGRLEDHYKLYLTLFANTLNSPQALENTLLKTTATQTIRLGDVAHVQVGPAPRWQRINSDGQEAVLLLIYQQPDANSVALTQDVQRALHLYKPNLPHTLQLIRWYQQSQLVQAAVLSVRDAVLLGTLLAALVLLLFLRNLRITLVAVIVVPSVICGTLLLMYALGMSLNIMTLGGIAASVGLIMDDAIVMVEQLMRSPADTSAHRELARIEAAQNFLRPLFGSTAATLIIFIPLAFLTGVTGAFFKSLALTMSLSLLLSFSLCWLMVPLLANLLLRPAETDTEPSRWEHFLLRTYAHTLKHLLQRPWIALALVLPLLGAGFLAWQHVGSGFMPSMDEGGFTIDYRTRPGTSLAETDRLVRQMEQIIQSNPNVKSYSRRTGAQLGGWLTEANAGDIFIHLQNGPRESIENIMEDIRRKILARVPGLDIEMAQLMEDLIGDLTAVPQPVEIKIFGDNPQVLNRLANRINRQLEDIPGLVDRRNGINPSGDALNITVDPHKAAQFALTPEAVYQQVRLSLQGQPIGRLFIHQQMRPIRLWWNHNASAQEKDLLNLPLLTPGGSTVSLGAVATLQAQSGQNQIDRENLKRMVAVTARIEGQDMGRTLRLIKKKLAAPGLFPATYYYHLGGLYEQQQQAFHGLLRVMLAAIALVFLLLLFLYEQFTLALAMLCMPLLALSAVFMGLWLTQAELNISSMMGMTMVVGIVTEAGIFYFCDFDAQHADLPLENRLIMAGTQRLRPILMTTLTAILTLLPLACALGQGSSMQQPLAIAIISGLCVQLPLTLLVLPCLYLSLQRLPGKFRHH